jgi:hypothetical protein
LEKKRFKVSGPGADSLFDLVKEKLKKEGFDRYAYSNDGVHVYVLEKYYVNLKVTLLSVMVFDHTKKDECSVEIVSTEHQADVLDDSWLWSAEKRGKDPLVEFLKALCKDMSWDIKDA